MFNRLWAIVKADLLRYGRSPRVWVSAAMLLIVAWIVIPPAGAGRAVIVFAGRRPLYDSAYVGTAIALIANLLLSLGGFYLVGDMIGSERRTRIGELVSASPISNGLFLLAKFGSGILLLSVLGGLTCLGAAVIQLWRAESSVDLAVLITPFFLTLLPTSVLLSGLSLCLDNMGLRGSRASLAYGALWIFSLLMVSSLGVGRAGSASSAERSWLQTIFDIPGVLLIEEPFDTMYQVYPDLGAGGYGKGWMPVTQPDVPASSLPRWPGIALSSQTLASRAPIFMLGFLALGLAAILFDRFDPTGTRGSQ